MDDYLSKPARLASLETAIRLAVAMSGDRERRLMDCMTPELDGLQATARSEQPNA
jgi:hypothetical protein